MTLLLLRLSPLASPPSPLSARGGAPPSLPSCPVLSGEFSIDFNLDRDLEGMGMDRSESPPISSFSTAGAVNSFSSRTLASISRSSEARRPRVAVDTTLTFCCWDWGSFSINRSSVIVDLSSIADLSDTPSSLKHTLFHQPRRASPCRAHTFRGSPAGTIGTSRPPSMSAPLPVSSTQAGDAPTPSSPFLPQSPVMRDDVEGPQSSTSSGGC
ncbi:hypothetical protein GALMADRAFT_232714 [Galerina marginata CBS 339.88]|uniref:Uncharacterized protein n=1 Tax=Galerina marginata (strain CBS 339.88) TaxID=685588 RepID=A0A067SEE5_GALM3|nr:hypothetical protein GALMADRAFT_232714 [Galerina marginata CBS 339.88]